MPERQIARKQHAAALQRHKAMRSSEYKWTGERILETDPICAASPLLEEHLVRYRFVSELVKGKKVLDAACGTGYGSDIMAKSGAKEITGVDISEDAIQHAKRNYTGKNTKFLVMDASKLKFKPDSFDAVVSFETIEHLKNWKGFLDGISKVLKKNGTLILSTPNRLTYSGETKHNHFHYKEFDPAELEGLLKKHFNDVKMHYQRRKVSGSMKGKLLSPAVYLYNRIGRKLCSRPLPSSIRKAGRHAENFSADVEIHLLEKDIEPLYLVAVCANKRGKK